MKSESSQDVLAGKTNFRTVRHAYVFRRLFRCGLCGYALIGEHQKGHVYYRCHTHGCPTAGVREEYLDRLLRRLFGNVRLRDGDYAILFSQLEEMRGDIQARGQTLERTLGAEREQIAERLHRLTDAYVDGLLDKAAFEERRAALLSKQRDVEDRLKENQNNPTRAYDRAAEYLERSKSLRMQYESGIPSEQREMVQIATSNRTVSGKNVAIELQNPFREIARARKMLNGDPYRGRTRTILNRLVETINKQTY